MSASLPRLLGWIALALSMPGWSAENQGLSRALEFRYVSSASAANGETDFKGETAVFTTDKRVAFLNAYTDYASRYFGVPNLDQDVIGDAEVAEALGKLKEQPLPQVRTRIPLKEWHWLALRPGENATRRAALAVWNTLPGVRAEGGALRFTSERASLRREFVAQNWRLALQWDLRVEKTVPAAFRLCDGEAVVTSVGMDARGRCFYTSEGREHTVDRCPTRKACTWQLELDFTAGRYNFYLDGKLLADYVPLANSAAKRVDTLVVEAGDGVALDNLWGVGFAPAKESREERYSIATFLDEDFETKPELDGWQTARYDDSAWGTAQLPYAVGGERCATEDLYLRCTVKLGGFERAFLSAETLDPGGEIWVNGRVAAVVSDLHPVRIDVTSYLTKNSDNVLGVKVNSCRRGGWAADPYVGWFAGRMHLDLVRDTHIEEVLANATDVGDPARVRFRVRAVNERRGAFKGSMVVRFYPWHPEASESPVASASFPITLHPYANEQIEETVEVPRPRLWTFQHPNLYRVQVVLQDATGAALDDEVVTTGLRIVSQEGGTFSINGKPEMLNGPLFCGMRPPLDKIATWTRCAPTELLLKDLLIARNMNGNCVRVALASLGVARDNWPTINDPRLADMGDQLGVMFIWHTSGGIWWGNAWSVDWEGYQQDIRQVYNHPSIIVWEVSNEGTTPDWNDWYQKMYDTLSPVDLSRLISGYSHLAFPKDKPEQDAQGKPMKPGWTAPMVTRGNHDLIVGYGAEWSRLRKWDRGEAMICPSCGTHDAADFLNSPDRAFFNFEGEESIGQPNWDLVKGKPWYQLQTYEWKYDDGSIGRKLECDEWRASQGWQAFGSYESIKKQRMMDYDGFQWCCLDGGLFSANYHDPLLDYFYHAKLAYYAIGMVFQRTLAGSNNVDVVYGPRDEITPMVLNLGETKTVDVKVEIKTNRGRVVDARAYRGVRLAGGRSVTMLAAWRPRFPCDGYYAIEYTTRPRGTVR